MYENVFETSVRWRQFCSGFVRLIDVISRLLSLTVMWPVTKHLTHGTSVVIGQTHRTSAIRCGSSRHINKTGHSGGHNWSYYPGTLSSSRVKSLRLIWRSGTHKPVFKWVDYLKVYRRIWYPIIAVSDISHCLMAWSFGDIYKCKFVFWSKFHQRSCA